MAIADPILDEIRAIRETLADDYADDLERLARDVNEAAEKAGRRLETLPPKRIPPEAKKAS